VVLKDCASPYKLEVLMNGHDIITIGVSADGLEALKTIVGNLPSEFPAAVFIVSHMGAGGSRVLADTLSRVGPLRAVYPEDRDPIQPGRIYVAPPDHHMSIEGGCVRITRGPKENRRRPSVDVLFRSAAHAHGAKVVGVVLIGNLNDGTAGLLAIKQCGGVAVVQDPAEAPCLSMPKSAMERVRVDYCLPLSDIAPLLSILALDAANEDRPASSDMETEVEIATGETKAAESLEKLGRPSEFTCPECHGVLWELNDNDLLRFRCRAGHAYLAESLHEEQSETEEDMLWEAFRALEEGAALARRIAESERERNRAEAAMRYEESAQKIERRATAIQQMLLEDELSS
jgi:two-component system, chemotaxis family, protein-glutamate methylesterase/glutaminase